MKYIRYRRKSSEHDERQALSIGSQKIELERKFPELEIIHDIEESKSAFIPDRLSRNEIDAATITYLVGKGNELPRSKLRGILLLPIFKVNPQK